MRRTLFFATLMLAIAPAVYGREGLVYLTKPEGQDPRFTLTALRHDDGAVLVKVVVPPDSPLYKCSYLRLDIRDMVKGKGRILLTTKLATSKTEKGEIVARFQIHDSLAQKACVGFAWEATRGKLSGDAKLARIKDYITDKKPKPAGS